MSRVITFSRTFPSYHPKAGQPTYFVEKIWKSLGGASVPYATFSSLNWREVEGIKHHTIRAGHRWKVGDWFSPRVWSGKPYNSKQIIIAPDIQIKNIWDFEIHSGWAFFDGQRKSDVGTFGRLANNDGLEFQDLKDWLKYPKNFDGQIICWNESANY